MHVDAPTLVVPLVFSLLSAHFVPPFSPFASTRLDQSTNAAVARLWNGPTSRRQASLQTGFFLRLAQLQGRCERGESGRVLTAAGSVAFPHELCKTADDIRALTKRLPTDPLVLKAYPRVLTRRLLTNVNVKESISVLICSLTKLFQHSETERSK